MSHIARHLSIRFRGHIYKLITIEVKAPPLDIRGGWEELRPLKLQVNLYLTGITADNGG